MFRRCTSMLLLLGICASQLASIPHVHGVGGSRESAGRPHIHLAWFCHHHDHADPHHDHCHQTAPGRSIGPERDHESDAVYLAMSPVPSRAFGLNLADAHVVPFAVLAIAVPNGLQLGDRPTVAWSSSLPLIARGCALYLALRALRI